MDLVQVLCWVQVLLWVQVLVWILLAGEDAEVWQDAEARCPLGRRKVGEILMYELTYALFVMGPPKNDYPSLQEPTHLQELVFLTFFLVKRLLDAREGIRV
jgi:hypothetical protein